MDRFLRFVVEAMPSVEETIQGKIRHLSVGWEQQGIDSAAHHRFGVEVHHHPCRRIHDIGGYQQPKEADRPAQDVWVFVVEEIQTANFSMNLAVTTTNFSINLAV